MSFYIASSYLSTFCSLVQELGVAESDVVKESAIRRRTPGYREYKEPARHKISLLKHP